MSFCMGNAVKYVWRYRSKNKPVEDLKKALWYTHYAENRNEPVALTCRQLGIIMSCNINPRRNNTNSSSGMPYDSEIIRRCAGPSR